MAQRMPVPSGMAPAPAMVVAEAMSATTPSDEVLAVSASVAMMAPPSVAGEPVQRARPCDRSRNAGRKHCARERYEPLRLGLRGIVDGISPLRSRAEQIAKSGKLVGVEMIRISRMPASISVVRG